MPPKRDGNAWKKLREYVNERRHSHLANLAKAQALRQHRIERRIAELQERPPNKERDRLIKKLREALEALADP